jgi:glyoxylase-like metal-dependent hydrolase (beta-lactamase superfamily II)
MRKVLESLEPVSIDEHVEDGTHLDVAGGTQVIFTPGHTPGHISLYLERPKVLITGDALTAEGGSLKGPNQAMTPDMQTAAQSVRKLVDLDVDLIVCYHGGVVGEDANGQLQRVMQEISRDLDK